MRKAQVSAHLEVYVFDYVFLPKTAGETVNLRQNTVIACLLNACNTVQQSCTRYINVLLRSFGSLHAVLHC